MATENVQRVGEYEILSLIGAGGMGRVYRVRNIISNREEAMKILLPDFARDPELTARFMSEIRTLAGLEHPNIAQLRTAIQVDNQFVMVMEYVEGTTLDKLAPQLQASQDMLLDYALQTLAALSYAHGRGVTHRDIKPANIMITSHGVVKLMDFGIAKSATDLNLTRPGTTMGSIYYMSPEQVRGGTIDARSDIYSFGVTLYEILTGRKPFQADTSYSVLNAQVNETPLAPAQVNPGVPQPLSDIVMRAMAKDPGQRFQTAEEFRSALKALREAEPVQPRLQAAPIPVPVPGQGVSQAPSATPYYQTVLDSPPPAAQQAAPPAFTPVAVVAPPAPARPAQSHRGLWIALGSLATVLALVAAGIVLPRFYAMYAGQKSNATSGDTKATTSPAGTGQQSAGATTAGQPAGAAENTVANPPVASPATNTVNAAPAGGSKSGASGSTGTSSSSGSPAGRQQQSTGTPAQAGAGGQGTTGTGVNQPPPGPSPAEIRQAHDRFTGLDARAEAAGTGVEQIRSQQQAEGLDIRGDVLASLTRMNSYMRDADRALSQKDLASANDYMDRANGEIEKLEKFLGR